MDAEQWAQPVIARGGPVDEVALGAEMAAMTEEEVELVLASIVG